MPIEVIPSGGALGAEIRGVDLTQEIDPSTAGQIKQAFYRHEVVFFRGRELSDDDHVRFSAHFGTVRRLPKPYPSLRPEIGVVSNIVEDGQYIGKYDAGMFWHTDGAYVKNPVAVSLLRALEVPQRDGRALGDTAFASMTAAYEALSSAMKKRIEGLQAVNSLMLRYEKTLTAGVKKDVTALGQFNDGERKGSDAVHPVVKTHPVTGRKCLYVSEGFSAAIVGMAEDESKDLLAELTRHCVQPQFVYRHHWQTHDLLMWDNIATQHKATFDYQLPLRRRMHRTTVNVSTATP